MNDRNIEDTRQPKEPPRYSPCDECGSMFDTDDLTETGSIGWERWLCEDCLNELPEPPEDDDE